MEKMIETDDAEQFAYAEPLGRGAGHQPDAARRQRHANPHRSRWARPMRALIAAIAAFAQVNDPPHAAHATTSASAARCRRRISARTSTVGGARISRGAVKGIVVAEARVENPCYEGSCSPMQV